MSAQVNVKESKVTAVAVCFAVPIPLTLLFTGLRLFVKLRPSSPHRMALDDYAITSATIVSIALCVSGLVYGPPHGFGRHIAALPAHEIKTFFMGDYVFSHFYNLSIAGTKLAILALYYRIFSTPVFRRVVMGTAVFISLWILAMEVGLGVECIPIARVWDWDMQGWCLNLVAFSYFTNITNLVTDVWVSVLPIPIIVSLHITPRRKVELAAIFAVGLLTCAVSIVRLTVIVTRGSADFTWRGVPLGILSVYEPLGGIVCANLPFLYRFFTEMAQKLIFLLDSSLVGSSVSSTVLKQARHSAKENRNRTITVQSEWIV